MEPSLMPFIHQQFDISLYQVCILNSHLIILSEATQMAWRGNRALMMYERAIHLITISRFWSSGTTAQLVLDVTFSNTPD